MKKALTLIFSLFAVFATAQDVLEVEDISQPNDVYSSPDEEAAVIIRCHHLIPLRFSSSMDKSAEPFRTDLEGTDSVYYIAFPTGNRYRGRELTIISSGYNQVVIPLELEAKQLRTYQLTDPNSMVDAGCYRTHRNKGVEEIKNSNYEEARNQFVVARECSDCNNTENERNIATVDSLILLRKMGDQAFTLLDYAEAVRHYSQIMAINAYDNYAANRYTLCMQNFNQECASIMSKAEYYYSEKELDKASELFQKVIDMDCSGRAIAVERLNTINTNMRAKKDHARVFTYEWRKDAPIGIHYGKYNMHKVGGFFQLDFNSAVFDAIRSDCKYGDTKFPEMNMSFGWTVKIYNPVWLHVGPGFTGKMYYGSYLDDKFPTIGYGETSLLDQKEMGTDLAPKEDASAEFKDGWKKANLAFAISPVIGVTAKYSYFALRLTYSYRWTVQSKLADFMGRSRLSIGVGVAF